MARMDTIQKVILVLNFKEDSNFTISGSDVEEINKKLCNIMKECVKTGREHHRFDPATYISRYNLFDDTTFNAENNGPIRLEFIFAITIEGDPALGGKDDWGRRDVVLNTNRIIGDIKGFDDDLLMQNLKQLPIIGQYIQNFYYDIKPWEEAQVYLDFGDTLPNS